MEIDDFLKVFYFAIQKINIMRGEERPVCGLVGVGRQSWRRGDEHQGG